jgi:hypothetical protein
VQHVVELPQVVPFVKKLRVLKKVGSDQFTVDSFQREYAGGQEDWR